MVDITADYKRVRFFLCDYGREPFKKGRMLRSPVVFVENLAKMPVARMDNLHFRSLI